MALKPLLMPLLLAACMMAAGCAGSDRPATAHVRGKVTYHGQPVAGATVAFLCPGAPRPAVGTTDEAGNYQLTTFEPNDGAVIGTHVVTVNVYVTEADVALPTVEPGDSEAVSKAISDAMRQTARQIARADQARPLLPSKYADRRTSDLHKEVVRGNNFIDIELSD